MKFNNSLVILVSFIIASLAQTPVLATPTPIPAICSDFLQLTDLEGINIAHPRGGGPCDAAFLFTDLAGSVPAWGLVYDNQNTIYDMYDGWGQVKIRSIILTGTSTQAGDSILLTYDGNQKKRIYLPVMAGYNELYVGSDGSTYYDQWLCQTAQEALPPSPTPTPTLTPSPTPEGFRSPSPTPSFTPTPENYLTPSPSPLLTPTPLPYCCPIFYGDSVTLTDQRTTGNAGLYDSCLCCGFENITWWTSCSNADWVELIPEQGLNWNNYQMFVALGDTSYLSPGPHQAEVFILDNCGGGTSGHFYINYDKSTPSATPSLTPAPSPAPGTYYLTIERDIGIHPLCSSCSYEVYLDGPHWGIGTYVGAVPITIPLTEGFHEIFFYEIIVYNGGGVYFWHWEDGSKETYPRSIDIHEDTTWTMKECYVPCLDSPYVDVSINEIAWMGTDYDASHQWLEIYNAEDLPIGFMNFSLTGNSMSLDLADEWTTSTNGWYIPGDRKAIPAHGYFLIEKHEDCVSDIPGDIVTTDLNITASGDNLTLISFDNVVDNVNCSSGWFAGDQNYYYTMERRYPRAEYYGGYGNNPINWADWNGSTWNGKDGNGDPLNATVKRLNTMYSSDWPPPTPPTPSSTETPSSTPTPTPTVSPSPSPNPQSLIPIIESGDYDGDGISDIAIFRGSSGLWAVRGVTRVYYGGFSDVPVPGDYNGDGTADIGIFRGGSGLWGVRGVTRVYYGSSPDIPIPGDYDGDGSCDVGIFRSSGGLWAVTGVTRAYFGGPGDLPVPGDYNGDGTKDIALFRGSSGMWAIQGMPRVYYGSSSDSVVPGDYDGDGTWEIGIFRPNTGMWGIRGVTRAYYGSTSDQPVPADFDGDGLDDTGIFRPSSGLWAIRGLTRAYFGTPGDLPVSR